MGVDSSNYLENGFLVDVTNPEVLWVLSEHLGAGITL